MAEEKPQNNETSEELALARLERQVERGSLFTHTIVSRNADEIHEVESFLYGVIDVLVEKGMVTQDEVLQSAGKVRREMETKGRTVGPSIALRIEGDDKKEDGFVPVNCSERLHICKAVCCKLHFALTAGEVESGQVKWDLGAPYYIRHESNGCCHHLDPTTKGCSIYKNRPGVCRRYSCAQDDRIWDDFDNMVLNQAWIDEHIGASVPRLMTAQMLPQKLAAQLIEEISKTSTDDTEASEA